MGQAQSDPGVSTKRPLKDKVKKKTSGESLARFLRLFSLLTCCVRPTKRESASTAKTNDDTDSECSLAADGCRRDKKGHRTKKGEQSRQRSSDQGQTPDRSPRSRFNSSENGQSLEILLDPDQTCFPQKTNSRRTCTVLEVVLFHPVFSPLSGPLVLYRPVWLPAPSPTPVLQLTDAGKLLLSILISLDSLTFFMAPVWSKHYPKVYLTLAGKRTLEALTVSRGQPVLPEPEKEASQSEENSKRFHKEELFEEDLPLMDTWNASEFHHTRRNTGRLQTLEDVMQIISIVMANRTQLWWRRQLHIDILTPEGLVTVSTIKQEVTGVQLLDRRMSHVTSHCINMRKEFAYFEDGQEVDVTTNFEGFASTGDETRTMTWSHSNTESTFRDPPPPRSPHGSPPPPAPSAHFDNSPQDIEEDIVEESVVEVPLMQSYFAYKGTTDFEGKLAALRIAFKELTNTANTLNYISHAGRMVLGGLVELNNQDVREFQQAFDRLVSFVNEPGNRQAMLEEIGQTGITQVNFLDLFFEMILLGLLEGKTAFPAPRPNGFLHLMFAVIMSIRRPGQSWSQRSDNFLYRIKSQMRSWMDAIFDLELHLYGCPEILCGEVLGNLEMQVEYLLSSLD